ncbi:DUF2914 domain-containing protein [Candidatus Kaiserbacteria bacterium]|nr:DUF2914 domain-containing protein [Candidatus Kaiserbacteria bacterium]
MFQNFQKLIRKHKKHWLTIAFVLGFVVDNITLNRVDQLFDNFVLTSYVLLAMGSLLLLYAGAAEKLPERMALKARDYAPLVAQYAFGGLFSGMLIFYGRAGSWYESWPFLLVILAVIFGNEMIRERSQRLIFNLSVLFIGMFSYIVLLIPVILGKMGALIFIGSGFLALIIMYWYVKTLRRIVPKFIALHQRAIVFSIGFIFALFNILYFTNVIPPIPLSLKEIGIYHSVVKFETGEYRLTYQEPPWWAFLRDSDTEFHIDDGGNIFCFAAVFAPTRLSTEIYHQWQYYNPKTEEWEDYSRLSYSIAGGRDGGFRGYTLISNYQEGKWRCVVETGRGQVLGSTVFDVVPGVSSNLVTRVE